MRRLLVPLLVLALLAVKPATGSTFTPSTIDPAVFALTASDFPTGSQVIKSMTVSDTDIAVLHLQIGPALPIGHIASYFMQAQKLDSKGALGLVTSYLASIFQTPDEAASAFKQQNDYWQSLEAGAGSAVQTNALAQDDFGDTGFEGSYTLTDANGHTHTELFFRRQQIFVQLNLDGFSVQPSPGDVQIFRAMGKKLDALAVQVTSPGYQPPTTPTVTPTATPTVPPTATATPRPTATKVPPTARPSYYQPIQEGKNKPRCKKGYKLVKGKCVKQKP